jgi:hypothetical protein
VWAELRRLPKVPAADVRAVAAETMRRVARHVARLADAQGGLGFVPAFPTAEQRTPPTGVDLADLDRLEAEIGPLPAAFTACLREVGEVDFLGDCPALALYHNEPEQPFPPRSRYVYLPDPMSLNAVGYLRYQWDGHRADGHEDAAAFSYPFAPDELHKANTSGGTHDLRLPDPSVDPASTASTGGRE